MARRRRLPRAARDILLPIQFGVLNVATGAAGTATQPLLPAGTQNPLTIISQTGTRFAAPLTSVVGAGIVIREVRRLKPKKRRKRT